MRKKKKTHIKLKSFIVLLLIIGIICGFIYYFFTLRIHNLYIENNKVLTEQEIIDLCELSKETKYYRVTNNTISKRIKSNSLIESIKVVKKLNGDITLTVKEYKILFFDEISEQVYLSSKKSTNYNNKILGIPHLINKIVDSNILNDLIEKLNEVDDNILIKISEIEYSPVPLDNERFLLLMNDQNYVYLTINKFNYINKYEEILEELDGRKGILYLDSGNHFVIKNK